MHSVNEEHDSELLEAQAHLWNHIFSFINSMTLKCAIQLGIPDVIHSHGKPMTLTELVAALPLHPSKAIFVYRLMCKLVHSGFFTIINVSKNDEKEEYGLTNASKLLLKDNPLSVRPFLLAMLNPLLTSPWNHLSTWFQNNDSTPFSTAHGMTIWEYAGREPMFNDFLNEAMSSDGRLTSSVVINECKDVFEGLESLVDVGGRTGTFAQAISEAIPHLECTVFDLPHVVAGMRSHGNLKYVGGDMFEVIPPADAVLLKWVLHDWNDEECLKILKKCKKAITSNKKKTRKVIIIKMLVENQNQKGNDKSIETQLFFDMEMMVLVRGKERDEKEWAKLFLEAGFSRYEITLILGLRSLIEVYP